MVGGLWLHRHRIPHIDGGGVVHSRELTASTVALVTIARWSFAHFVRFFAFAHLASTALRATSRFDGARAGHGDSTAALPYDRRGSRILHPCQNMRLMPRSLCN